MNYETQNNQQPTPFLDHSRTPSSNNTVLIAFTSMYIVCHNWIEFMRWVYNVNYDCWTIHLSNTTVRSLSFETNWYKKFKQVIRFICPIAIPACIDSSELNQSFKYQKFRVGEKVFLRFKVVEFLRTFRMDSHFLLTVTVFCPVNGSWVTNPWSLTPYSNYIPTRTSKMLSGKHINTASYPALQANYAVTRLLVRFATYCMIFKLEFFAHTYDHSPRIFKTWVFWMI